jgi:hypothetical protein
VTGEPDGSGRAGFAAELRITGLEPDSLGIPLRPMGFQGDELLAELERWGDNAVLLDRLSPRSGR